MENNHKVCGIIAEYNPFHNGHKYQLDLIKKAYDTVVVVMSGSFTQRGDTAIIDKWSRTRSALISGADLVLELPVAFSMSTADRFAFGAINLLNSLLCVDALSFGSESGDINELESAAHNLLNESSSQSLLIQSLMKDGMPYAAARQKAFSGIIPDGILNEPNNILAVEYIKHILLSGSSMIPITHKRTGSAYNSENLHSPMASAAAIRANISSDKIREHMPEEVFKIFQASSKHYLKNLDNAAIYHIRAHGPDCLKPSLECVEGLENRIFDASKKFSTIEEIANYCSTKRYTKAKIRRIILSSMLGIDQSLCKQTPTYSRVLGATETGCKLLGRIKDTTKLSIITKTADFRDTNSMFYADIMATDIWALSCENDKNKQAGTDYSTSPVMI